MEINTIGPFLDYYEKIRQRTLKVTKCIPPEKIDWTYKEGKFTFADLIRHIASIERYMYAENAQLKPSRYPGHGKELADGYEGVLAYMDRMHKESMEIFSRLSDEDLRRLYPEGDRMHNLSGTVGDGFAQWYKHLALITTLGK